MGALPWSDSCFLRKCNNVLLRSTVKQQYSLLGVWGKEVIMGRMMGRHIKQLIYGGAYFLILVSIFGGIYFTFLRPEASCTNGRKDGNEEGIDCGGACETVCLPRNLRPLLVEDAEVFHPAPDAVSAFAKVRNPNTALAARSFSYRFEFFDSGNRLLWSTRGNSFIYASEIKYLAEFSSFPDASRAVRVQVRLLDPEWVKAADYAKPNMTLQDRRIENDEDGIRITGRLVHRDTVNAPVVRIVALFSGGGKILGVSETELDDVYAGESRLFTIVHPSIPGADPARTELAIFARRP